MLVCLTVASTALLVFDTILTMPDEVELIWRRKWNLSTALYFTTRYLAFVDGGIAKYRECAFLHIKSQIPQPS